MSRKSLDAFRRSLATDAELLEKVRQARLAATVQVATAAGFEITAEELAAVVEEVSSELCDERLEAVAGGLLNVPVSTRIEPLR